VLGGRNNVLSNALNLCLKAPESQGRSQSTLRQEE
jgi:hypothetical protein